MQIPRRRSEALVAGLFVGFPLSDADITDSSKRLCKFMHRLVCVCVSDSRRDNPVCFLDQSQLNWAERKHMVSLSYFLQSAPFSSPWLPSSLFLLFPGFVSVETNLLEGRWSYETFESTKKQKDSNDRLLGHMLCGGFVPLSALFLCVCVCFGAV